MPLQSGSFSLHNYLSVHRSAPNRAGHRRVGLGLNFMPTCTRPMSDVRPAAMLVRGEDCFGHFVLMQPPADELDSEAVGVHERATTLYRQNYAAIQALHDGPAAGAGV